MNSKVLLCQWFIMVGFIGAISDGAELSRKTIPVTVEVRMEEPKANLPEVLRRRLTFKRVGEVQEVRKSFELNVPQTIELVAGEYEFYASISNPLYEGFGSLTVPATDSIVLLLKEPDKRTLKIRVLDEKEMSVPGCSVKLSYVSMRKKWGISKFAATGLSHAREMTDDKGECTFEFIGIIPEKRISIEVLNQDLQLIGPEFVKPDKWKSAEPLKVRVRHKKFHGSIPLYIQIGDKRESFLRGVASFGKGSLKYARVKINRVHGQRGKPTHYDVRFCNDAMPLHGIGDGAFYLTKITLMCSQGFFELYPLGDNLLAIEKGEVVETGGLVFAEDVNVPFSLKIVCAGQPVSGARISLQRPGFGTTVRTDAQGCAQGTLPAGKYKLTAQHIWHEPSVSEVVLNKDNKQLSLRMVAWPVLAGKAKCNGIGVAKERVRVLFEEESYESTTNPDGTFRLPLKEKGGFLLGIGMKGFVEYWQFNTTSDKLTNLQIALTPRVNATVVLTGKHRTIVENGGSIGIFAVDNKALGGTCRLDGSGKCDIAAVPGQYQVVLATAAGEKVYDLGLVSVSENGGTVVIDLDIAPRVLSKPLVEYLQRSGRLK